MPDDPGVGSREQKDVWRMAKFSSLASTVTKPHRRPSYLVIASLSKCEVFRGTKCIEQLRRKYSFATGVVPWSADIKALRLRDRSPVHATLSPLHRLEGVVQAREPK